MGKVKILSAVFFLMAAALSGQSDTISYGRVGLVTGLTAGGFIAGYGLQTNMWWKGEKSEFHSEWINDWRYALGADKIGHAFFPYLVARTYSDILQWCKIDEQQAVWYSSGFGLFYQTLIEIRDGFSKEWGFSWGDFGADVIGAGLPIAQYYCPELKNFSLKISYYPSYRFKHNSNRYIMDDYESTFHWISVNCRNILPVKYAKILPKFVNLALGHNVQGLDLPGGGRHQLYIALDWNLEEIPTDSAIIKFFLKIFNHYHLPSPVIKIYPEFAGLILKF